VVKRDDATVLRAECPQIPSILPDRSPIDEGPGSLNIKPTRPDRIHGSENVGKFLTQMVMHLQERAGAKLSDRSHRPLV
jgi:hypothetical protein